MKPGDAVLVRGVLVSSAGGEYAWVAVEVDALRMRAPWGSVTTDAAIRADERRRVAEWMRRRADDESVVDRYDPDTLSWAAEALKRMEENDDV